METGWRQQLGGSLRSQRQTEREKGPKGRAGWKKKKKTQLLKTRALKYGQKSCMLLMRLQTAVYGEAQPNRHERKVAVLTKFGVFIIEAGLELQMPEDGFEKKKDAGKHVLFNLQKSSSRT